MSRLFLSAFLVLVSVTAAHAASISNVTTDPASPASLNFEDRVEITFDYDMMGLEGRIFARPFVQGVNSPNRFASGSGIFSGTGTTTAVFGIMDAGQGFEVVDQIRFQIVSTDQTVLFFEEFIDVQFSYGTPPPAVPLPASAVLLVAGLLGLGALRPVRT